MKIHELSLEKLMMGLIDPGMLENLEVEAVDPSPFEVPNNVIQMPIKAYITMSQMHAIDVHLQNLITTFGIEAVREGLMRRGLK